MSFPVRKDIKILLLMLCDISVKRIVHGVLCLVKVNLNLLLESSSYLV